MGKKSPSPPPAPDPVATANAQGAANSEAVRESAKVNQINTIAPGYQTYFTGDIGSGDRYQVTELAPQQQRIFDTQQAVAEQLTNLAKTRGGQITQDPFTLNGITALPGQNDLAGFRQRAEDATFDRFASRINEDFGNQQKTLETQLANSGIPVGSVAYGKAVNALADSRGDAIADATARAITAGTAEQQNQLSIADAIRNRQISDLLLERTQPANELSALIQGAPALGTPQAAPVANYQVAPADVQGAYGQQYAAQQNAYNQQVGARNSKMGATAGLGGSLGGAYIMGR